MRPRRQRIVEFEPVLIDGVKTWLHYFSYAPTRIAWQKVILRPHGITRPFRFWAPAKTGTLFRAGTSNRVCLLTSDEGHPVIVEATPRFGVDLDRLARELSEYQPPRCSAIQETA